jgi:hypothetical protein
MAGFFRLVDLREAIGYDRHEAVAMSSKTDESRISVVYFTMIDPGNEHWQNVIKDQLMAVRDSGLFQAASSFDALLSTSGQNPLSKDEQDLLDLAESIVLEIAPNANVFTWIGNQYEFHGIRRMWELGQQRPLSNHYILYFHGKGMVNDKGPRSFMNNILTKVVVEDWQNVIQQFEANRNMTFAGYAISPSGWVWFNFIWARGTYLINAEKPELCEDRYYYESWIGRRTANQSSLSVKSDPCGKGLITWAGPDHGLTLCSGNSEKKLGFWCEATTARLGHCCPL